MVFPQFFLKAITTSADLRKLDFSTNRLFMELSFSSNSIQSMTIKARGVLLCSVSTLSKINRSFSFMIPIYEKKNSTERIKVKAVRVYAFLASILPAT